MFNVRHYLMQVCSCTMTGSAGTADTEGTVTTAEGTVTAEETVTAEATATVGLTSPVVSFLKLGLTSPVVIFLKLGRTAVLGLTTVCRSLEFDGSPSRSWLKFHRLKLTNHSIKYKSLHVAHCERTNSLVILDCWCCLLWRWFISRRRYNHILFYHLLLIISRDKHYHSKKSDWISN